MGDAPLLWRAHTGETALAGLRVANNQSAGGAIDFLIDQTTRSTVLQLCGSHGLGRAIDPLIGGNARLVCFGRYPATGNPEVPEDPG